MKRPEIKKIGNNQYKVTYPNYPPMKFVNIKPVPFSKAQSLFYSLHPKFKIIIEQFFTKLEEKLGKDYYVQINDALRTDEEQMKLYKENPQYAKKPGDSPHNFGVAVDFSVVERKTGKAVTTEPKIQEIVDEVAHITGVYWGGWFVSMSKEPWHVQISKDWKKTYEELTR